MKAFKNDPKLKEALVKEMKRHLKQDDLRQGAYAEDGKFCAVGCAIESLNKTQKTTLRHSDHRGLADYIDVPVTIERLHDRIFEGLEKADAPKFAIKLIEAIPVGADLSLVSAKFFIWLLDDKKHGVKKFATDRGKKAIDTVVKLYERRINGDEPTKEEWKNAADAAAAATASADAAAAAAAAYAAYAADAAAYADAADAATAAAAAAAAYAAAATASADAAAADAAAYADAADAAAYAAAAYARRKHFKVMADKLIKLIKETSNE